MKVHIGSDEKFFSGFFARFEFLHSLQVVFQFINTTSVLGIGKFVRRQTFIFRGFSRVVPFPPAAMKSLEIYLRFRAFTSTAKIVHTKYKSDEVFIQSSRIELSFESQWNLHTALFLDTRQSNELAVSL